MDDFDLLTVKEAAAVANVSTATLELMIRDQRHPLPVLRLGSPGGARRIARRDLTAYLRSCRQEHPTPARTRRWPKPGDELRPDPDLLPSAQRPA